MSSSLCTGVRLLATGKLGLGDAAKKDRELAVAFARQFGTLDEDAKNQIRSILASRKEVNQ
ncbi:MAG: hypothetical protein Q4B54_12300 [Coriobacteriales bacterium]|nr:hypothetical protein [Coriobacteriales bacterium]